MSDREPKKDRAVPLVMYKGGERIAIGQAIVKGDGSIQAQIAKDVRKELKDLLFGDLLGGISIDPKPLPNVHYSTYFNGTPPEPVETTVVLPLSVQE